VSGGCLQSKAALFASQGEGLLREGDELRQFPQILDGGGQQELVLGSPRVTEAQSTESEDALQMCPKSSSTFLRSRREAA
jgi:hypothetical protein